MRYRVLLSDKWKRNDESHFFYCSSQSLNVETDFIEDSLETIEEKQIDFGCIIDNPQKSEVVLITDRYATVPLYYTVHDDQLFVSDYIGALVDLVKPEYNKEAIVEQLCFDYVYTSEITIYKDIFKVPAGIKLKFSESFKKTYECEMSAALPVKRKQNWPDGTAEEIQTSINDSVKKFDNLYVPLSGGLDSRFVCGIIANSKTKQIYSRTYGEKNSLDVKYAKKLGKLMKINHHSVLKSDEEAISDFERLVRESRGTLNGVHAHDLQGRDIFEKDETMQARVSGFVGDLYARGTNMLEKEDDLDLLVKKIIGKTSNLNQYDYKKIIPTENAEVAITKTVKIKCENHFNSYKNFNAIFWDYYQNIRIPNMVSLLEYFSHTNKPNVKPFMIPLVRKTLSEYAGRDEWDGMNYVELAKLCIPKLVKVPFASNSVFVSKKGKIWFKIKRRVYQNVTDTISGIVGKYYVPLAFNATLNWRRILSKNADWVLDNIRHASLQFSLNENYILELFEEHKSGEKNHTEFLLRVINLGVLSKCN